MRSGLIVGALTALVLGGLLALTALASSQEDGDPVAASSAERQDDQTTPTPRDTDDPDAADAEDSGTGPPPWARSHKAAAKDRGKNAAWKEAWRQLTPSERAQKMRKLAKEHAEGMRTWRSCVDAAGDDEAERAACERPLPPGLAKKQQP